MSCDLAYLPIFYKFQILLYLPLLFCQAFFVFFLRNSCILLIFRNRFLSSTRQKDRIMEGTVATKPPGRGAPIALIIFILLAAGLAALAYVQYTSLQDTQGSYIDLEKKLEAAKQELQVAKNKYDNLFIDLLGFKDEEEIKAIVSKLPEEKDLKTVIQLRQDQYKELESLLDKTKADYEKRIGDLNNQIAALKKEAQDAAAASKKSIDEMNKKIAEIEAAKKAEIDVLNAKIKALEGEKANLKGQLDAANAAAGKKEAELMKAMKTLQAAIAAKEKEISELRKRLQVAEKTEDLRPEEVKATVDRGHMGIIGGRIESEPNRIDERTAFAEIDVGKEKGVKSGSFFEVFEVNPVDGTLALKADGTPILKGNIEVINAYDGVSYVKIIREDRNNPIKKGDIVYLSKERPRD